MDAAVLSAIGVGVLIAAASRSVIRRRREVMRSDTLVPYALRSMDLTAADAESAGLEDELREAEDVCRACRIAPQCRANMARPVGARVAPGCPNQPLFQSIRRHLAVLEYERGESLDSGAIGTCVRLGGIASLPLGGR